MRQFDIYVRQRIYEINAYVNELALLTEMAGYATIIVYTEPLAAVLTKNASAPTNYVVVDTNEPSAFLTKYADGDSSVYVYSTSEDELLTKYAKGDSTFVVGIDGETPLIQSFARANSTVVIATEPVNAYMESSLHGDSSMYFGTQSDPNGVHLEKFANGESTLFVGMDAHMIARSFAEAAHDAPVYIGTAPALIRLCRYRLFSDMENVTFADFSNMTMDDVIFIDV